MTVFVLLADTALVGVYSTLQKAFTAALDDQSEGDEQTFGMTWRIEWGGLGNVCCYSYAEQDGEPCRYSVYQDEVDYARLQSPDPVCDTESPNKTMN